MSIYLDNAATTYPKPEKVYRAVEDAMRRIGVGPGRGSHRKGLEAGRLVAEAREAAASLFGVKDSSRIVFTHSATEALNIAVLGLLRPGDHVVSTTMEHNSLVRPLKLMEKRGVEVTWVDGDRFGLVTAGRIKSALRRKTALVALSHCSNVTGTIQPVTEVGELTRGSGAKFLVDGAQSAGSVPIDVEVMGIDMLAVPGHKGLMGPQGTGLLYVAEGIELMPLVVGGTGGFSTLEEQPEVLPERFESGTLNTPGIAGLKAGIEFIMEAGIEAIGQHEATLVKRFVEGLMEIPGIKVYTPADPNLHGCVVSFTIEGMDPSEIGFRLDAEFDIAVRTGLHCAPGAHRTIGTFPQGTVRVSPGYFNAADDIDTLLDALRIVCQS